MYFICSFSSRIKNTLTRKTRRRRGGGAEDLLVPDAGMQIKKSMRVSIKI